MGSFSSINTLNTLFLIFILFLSLNSPAHASEVKRGQFFGAKATEYPSWFKASFLDFRDDIAEATAVGKRVMLFFHQDSCPYCNALVERNLSQIDIQQIVKKHFDVITINMWGDREVNYVDGKRYSEKTFADMLRVQFTPTVLFYNEQGKVILRLNGYRSPDRFKAELDYVAQHQEKDLPVRDYIKANLPATPSSKTLHPEDFFAKPPYHLVRQSSASARPLAVFFEQKDCPNCDKMHRNVLPDPQTRDIIKDFDVVQLDMWSKTPLVTPTGKATTAREWAKALDIQFAPTVVLFNEQGAEVIRLEALFKVFHTQSIFDYVRSGAYIKQPSFQRYLSDRAEHIQEQGRDVNIWRQADHAVKPSRP